ncbi:MAG: HEPN domain-containing protein [Phycisphaerae bacterium]|nr:HEPN domain-containing protein [Phycisphaerae bacterium]
MATLSSKPLISRCVLEELGATRLKEANALLQAGHYAGAIYLAGYAVECYLKVAICAALDWDELHGTFKSHDLDVLLLHSGLKKEMEAPEAAQVKRSFRKITEVWILEGKDGGRDSGKNIRYQHPSGLSEDDARSFLKWVNDPSVGVVPWVKGRT